MKRVVLSIVLFFMNLYALAQNSLDMTPIAGGFSMALIDAQYTATCKKILDISGKEMISNKDECIEMLNKLETAITSEEGCSDGVTCKPLIERIHELKKL